VALVGNEFDLLTGIQHASTKVGTKTAKAQRRPKEDMESNPV
jgi:hypothetical protein